MATTRRQVKTLQMTLPLGGAQSNGGGKRHSDAISEKIARISSGEAPRVLDLFAGCGGLSLGFHTAGAIIAAALEIDPDAACTHGLNFHRNIQQHCTARDITKTTPVQLASDLSLGDPSFAFDIIVGGPPCQAFARVGRSKLREIADHPEAFLHDPRSRLYIHYLNYVEVCKPLAVLMENVPDMLNHGGHNLAEEICEVLGSRGYKSAYTLLNAAFYGVPQMRERMFILGYRKEIAVDITFPSPSHWIELPAGYDGSRAVALKSVLANSGKATHYRKPPLPHPGLPRAITAEEAMGDLPPIYASKLVAAGELRRGTRRLNIPCQYNSAVSISDYAKLMRHWAGFEAGDAVCDHVIRYLPRDYNLFTRMKPGDQYPQAFRHAEEMFREKLQLLRRQGEEIQQGSKEWKELHESIVPPYDPGKFPNKWRKMEADRPARTLLAHLGKDTYSHIHYDSTQGRPISVREAARLQSFPDGFAFSGTMNPAFRQTGNAVPPLLALALAEVMLKQLRSAWSAEKVPGVAVGAK